MTARTLPLEDRLARAWPPDAWRDVTVLVAVSGGADSVALLRALRRLERSGPGRLVAAHFHHGLRGSDADEDERFVAALCEELRLDCQRGRGDVTARARREGDGLEAAARAARYAFLQETAAQVGARYVATAHTADDQVETILHRIVRGTGLSGLAGMRPARPLGPAATLVRPLLESSRADVLEYLEALGQPFREDASNRDTTRTRSALRHDVLPRLRQLNPRVGEALLRLGRLAAESQEVIDRQVAELAAAAVRPAGTATIEIRAGQLRDAPRYLVRELLLAAWRAEGWPLQAMSRDHWELLAALLLDEGGPAVHVLPGDVRAERRGDRLQLTAPAGEAQKEPCGEPQG